MLDGQGQLRITDFGLEGVAGELKDIRIGTPGYLGPSSPKSRQAGARKEVSVANYSLPTDTVPTGQPPAWRSVYEFPSDVCSSSGDSFTPLCGRAKQPDKSQ
jgi:hypothetical protein